MSLDALAFEQLKVMRSIWIIPGKDAPAGSFFRSAAWPLAVHTDARMVLLAERSVA